MIGNERLEHSGEPRGRSFGSDQVGSSKMLRQSPLPQCTIAARGEGCRKQRAGMKRPDRRMEPPESMRGDRTASLIAPPYCARPVDRVLEIAGHHQLDEIGMSPDERHRRSRRASRLEPAARDWVSIPNLKLPGPTRQRCGNVGT